MASERVTAVLFARPNPEFNVDALPGVGSGLSKVWVECGDSSGEGAGEGNKVSTVVEGIAKTNNPESPVADPKDKFFKLSTGTMLSLQEQAKLKTLRREQAEFFANGTHCPLSITIPRHAKYTSTGFSPFDMPDTFPWYVRRAASPMDGCFGCGGDKASRIPSTPSLGSPGLSTPSSGSSGPSTPSMGSSGHATPLEAFVVTPPLKAEDEDILWMRAPMKRPMLSEFFLSPM